MNSDLRRHDITFRQLVGPSLLTALLAGLLGSYAAMLCLAIASPGEPWTADEPIALVLPAITGAIIAIPVGFLALLIIGVPLTVITARPILTRPLFAIVVGTCAGAVVGTLVGLFLFGKGLAALTGIPGAVFGCVWIVLARRKIVSVSVKRSS